MISKSKFEESVYWFYHSDNLRSLLINADNLLDSHHKIQFSVQLVTSKFDIAELFNLDKNLEYKIVERKKDQDIHYFTIERKIKRQNETVKGNVLIVKYSLPNVYLIITHEPSQFIQKVLFKLLDNYYPKISRMSMDSKSIHDILRKLQSSLENKNIRIIKVIKKGWVKSEFAKKKMESDINWTDKSLEEVFQSIHESQEWIKSIDFAITRNKISNNKSNQATENQDIFFGYIDNYRISRDGLFKCNHNFSHMFKIVIEEIAKKASFNFELYDNRNRNKVERYNPKPLQIIFDYDIFRDKIENKRLINVLDKISYSSCSIYHGNPYFQASYVDYRDGSSYDIWVLSDEKITIVPQMRSSPASLNRLCESIFIGFREGIIKNFEGEYD